MRKKRDLKKWHRNRVVKSSIKTAIGGVNETISGKEANTAKETLLKAVRQLDKAVSKGVMHKNTAARRKSRLTKKINLLLAEPDNQ
jgi:small subunit ribosomal protein S20